MSVFLENNGWVSVRFIMALSLPLPRRAIDYIKFLISGGWYHPDVSGRPLSFQGAFQYFTLSQWEACEFSRFLFSANTTGGFDTPYSPNSRPTPTPTSSMVAPMRRRRGGEEGGAGTFANFFSREQSPAQISGLRIKTPQTCSSREPERGGRPTYIGPRCTFWPWNLLTPANACIEPRSTHPRLV